MPLSPRLPPTHTYTYLQRTSPHTDHTPQRHEHTSTYRHARARTRTHYARTPTHTHMCIHVFPPQLKYSPPSRFPPLSLSLTKRHELRIQKTIRTRASSLSVLRSDASAAALGRRIVNSTACLVPRGVTLPTPTTSSAAAVLQSAVMSATKS